MSLGVSDKTRRLLINVIGFGFGIVWVACDEIRSPRVFGIHRAQIYSPDELSQWNSSFGPQGKWAVEGDVLARMQNENWGKIKPVQEPPQESKTW